MVNTNTHVSSRASDKNLLQRECRRLKADLEWTKYPGLLYICISSPPGYFWRASGERTIIHHAPTYFQNTRDAVVHVMGLLDMGLEIAQGTHHESTCECEACEAGDDLTELDYESITYTDPEDLELDA